MFRFLEKTFFRYFRPKNRQMKKINRFTRYAKSRKTSDVDVPVLPDAMHTSSRETCPSIPVARHVSVMCVVVEASVPYKQGSSSCPWGFVVLRHLLAVSIATFGQNLRFTVSYTHGEPRCQMVNCYYGHSCFVRSWNRPSTTLAHSLCPHCTTATDVHRCLWLRGQSWLHLGRYRFHRCRVRALFHVRAQAHLELPSRDSLDQIVKIAVDQGYI